MPDTTPTPDLSTIVWRFRDDLSIVPQTIAGEQIYVVEDLLTGKCYRLGTKEYGLAAMLDGNRNLKEVLQALTRIQGMPSREHAFQVFRGLLQTGLVVPDDVGKDFSAKAVAEWTPRRANSTWPWVNLLFFRVPLMAPDAWLERMLPWAGWLHSAAAMMAATLLGTVAAVHVLAGWDRLVGSASNVFTVERGICLLLCGVVLKVLHELGHGLACKRYGGYVREAGVALFLFAPIPYVDVTSSWRLRSKWARIHIAAGGMYIEAIVGALAALLWSYTASEVVAQLCSDVLVMATATTILFNANPLMRFDGYYMLSDLVEAPNLYSRGQVFVRWLTRRVLLGDITIERPNSSRLEMTYGLATAWWRLVVCVSLIVGAAKLFHGAGIVLAAAATVAWFIQPLARFFNGIRQTGNRSTLVRLLAITSAAALLAVILGTSLKWPFPRRSPGIVEFKPITVVRAGSAGFVHRLMVTAGQHVRTGDVLAELRNDQLQDELRLMELDLEESRLQCRLYRQRGEMAKHQAELQQLATFQTQYEEKQKQVRALKVTASADGEVIGRTLPSLLGTYLNEGQELCRVGQEQAKEIQLSIHQDDVQAYQARLGKPLAIRGANGLLEACLSDISPRATDRATLLSLCAPHGGPLPVRTEHDDNGRETLKLLDPRFTGHITLDSEQSRQLRAGQLCTVMVRADDHSIAAILTSQLRKWISHKLQAD